MAASAAASSHALWVLAVLAALAFVKFAATLLIPIVVGVLASLALEPIVAWLTRRGVPRAMAAALVLAALLGGLGWGGYALRDRVASGLDALPDAARRLRGMVEATLESSRIEEASQAWSGEPRGGGGPALPEGAVTAGQRLGETVLAALGHATVVVFLVYFLLQSGPALATRVTQLPHDAERRAIVATILRDVNAQVQRFLLVQAFAAAVVAVATWLALAWLGAAHPLLWGLLAGAFNSIPYFGPVVVSGGLFLVGLAQEGGTTLAWQMAGAALAITSIEGWLLTPLLMGRAERMNVLAVFLGLMLWTWLWGAWGTLLAVPMLAVVKSVADHVDALRPLGRLMAATPHRKPRRTTEHQPAHRLRVCGTVIAVDVAGARTWNAKVVPERVTAPRPPPATAAAPRIPGPGVVGSDGGRRSGSWAEPCNSRATGTRWLCRTRLADGRFAGVAAHSLWAARDRLAFPASRAGIRRSRASAWPPAAAPSPARPPARARRTAAGQSARRGRADSRIAPMMRTSQAPSSADGSGDSSWRMQREK